ncbi:DNA adenine methylase [Staphylococcus pseudintermedius]|uniref:site-specific DNA-methyltransferase (adenine-specific) n=1 Tax=Staphylococcus pseudintermedius TaxID=283734 RepID=A0A7T7SVK6_STAPS|nr:DNA adenine methylase [Staphylococcus pseudintermedius]EGQ3440321.1 DNA adenine methylase [Staphylococcus pseudintermedius]EGQ3482379.1 DNA adenine methylase [Staphylococcus pseudintermedius]EGQ3484421.1 DNA adenine methylase [Staphylococcus pseudintermedius]EGQ3489301.1 DNA adenine methylase [Staphylococcus pseudintermedius]EGQ3494192.1 DNA adenine methylase [Staphylococcus pseudintermedius]
MNKISNLKSPLRYPGGKAKLYNKVKDIIQANYSKELPIYFEPFAGGGGLALKLLSKGIVRKIHINDFDRAIYAFWYSILYYTEDFCKKISETEVSISEWEKQKEIYLDSEKRNIFDLGFATFFLNRTNVSGILKAGVMGGKQQNGNYKIDCRFNKERLISQIKEIAIFKSKIEISNYDIFELLKTDILNQEDIFVYYDPPYVNKGNQLYKNAFSRKDHEKLASQILSNKNKYIITYDNVELIHNIYKENLVELININYSTGNTKKAEEILIYSKSTKT